MSHYSEQSEREIYEIIAITQLSTEWTNVFYRHREFSFEHCPAMVLIERVGTIFNKRETRSYEGIRQTMACFATVGAYGDLNPLVKSRNSGYLGTVAGGQPCRSVYEAMLQAEIADGSINIRTLPDKYRPKPVESNDSLD
jgi:hypothetical protein